MSNDFKRIPYGISSFKQVREEGLYLVDKSMFFEQLELAGNFFYIVRPRRFGKSLFLNMLEAYYDINEKDNFDKLFHGLYVADHPTGNRNKYLVMHLDFSQIQGDVDLIAENLNIYLTNQCNLFALKYKQFYPAELTQLLQQATTGSSKLNLIGNLSRQLGIRLYLIVDEYDNFTNDVLNTKGQQAYHELTHGTGIYRELFKKFKPVFDRIIMLGVSPITLDDLTSGYNIALNITMDPRFNQMLGFSEDDVRQMIRYYKEVGAIKPEVTEDSIIADMKPWYDNYCFAKDSFGREPSMFNSDMVCYYLSNLVGVGQRPEELIDPNTMTDYGKLKRLIKIDKTEGKRIEIIHDIAEKGFIKARLVSHFPAEKMMEFGNFVSLLYYYGMLTIGGVVGDRLKLVIPNNNVRLQYYQYLLDEYSSIHSIDISDLDDAFDEAALEGDWQPLISFICKAYHDTTAIRQLIEGERNLQGFMNAYLTLTNYYLVAPEMEFNHGYCDFFLLPNYAVYPMVRHSYILELKYLKADATDAEADRQWSEAREQIKTYAADKKLQSMLHGTQLHPIVVQIKGYDLVRFEEIN